ncbi:hypothetical protein [Mucilaginibacter arboris]|uniref:Uncharacterized protein n=1 Tax=Mucilaginibacter arboris TaxID=2682090 RepID=A0A7K1T0B1_9SPHI|nr:hypothetical protein [Mucilaginibacter arboris]MVN23011.1 hypothetical protein [Mucilaginibacter arboris]
MNNTTVHKEDLSYNLSRVDRSIADNLMDIDKSFGGDAQNVLDFILFISKKLNSNLFGYTKFTIKEYCDFTGMNPANLCCMHPDIANGLAKAPVYEGHKFESVLDYTLFRMLKENIIFSKVISYRDDGNILKLENFPILKDIYLQSGNILGTKKVYEVRLSDVIIDGFVGRYYNLDTAKLPQIAKGKGGHSRKKVYVWLNKIFHVFSSQGGKEEIPLYSVDFLADLAGVRFMKEPDKKGMPIEKEPKHKKEAVSNILKSIHKNINADKSKVHFSFDYKFVSGHSDNKYLEDYFVEFDFKTNLHPSIVKQLKTNHNLKILLLRELRNFFDFTYPIERLSKITDLENEKDSFQRWLNNSKADVEKKVEIIKNIYFKANGWDKKNQLKDSEALRMIHEGFIGIHPNSISTDDNSISTHLNGMPTAK